MSCKVLCPRHTAGKLDLHVGEPRDAGDEEVVQDIAALRQDTLLDGGGLVGLATVFSPVTETSIASAPALLRRSAAVSASTSSNPEAR